MVQGSILTGFVKVEKKEIFDLIKKFREREVKKRERERERERERDREREI